MPVPQQPPTTSAPRNTPTTTPTINPDYDLEFYRSMPPTIHPYANVPEAHINPVVPDSSAPAAVNSKGKEPAYKTIVLIQNPRTVDLVYDRTMKSVTVTVSSKELLSLSPELRQKHRDQVTPKRVSTTGSDSSVTATHVVDALPYADEDLDPSLVTMKHLATTPPAQSTTPDPSAPIINTFAYVLDDHYDQYVHSLPNGEQPEPEMLMVAKESHALRSIDMLVNNAKYVEAIFDPGSQIIAMSEAVCHQLVLQYDPHIRLNMQSAHSDIDLSLGLARNVPVRIGSITVYIQIHVIRSPAYDILLGRPFDCLTGSVICNY